MTRSRRPDWRPPPTSLRELEVRAEALGGHTIGEVAAALGVSVPVEGRRAKGFVGTLVEAALGADPNAGQRPDFPRLGVELKTVPIGQHGRPVESTFVCSIDMAGADRESWNESRVKLRLGCVLWVPVDGVTVAALEQRRVGKARLWSPSPAELEILRGDWEDLIGAIGAGRPPTAHDGRALQVRPKAATSRERGLAPDEDGPRRALPLGFYLRAVYTAVVLSGRGAEWACGAGDHPTRGLQA